MLSPTPAARAETAPPQPPDAAISVYVEQIPTGSGSVAVGGAGSKSALPKAIEKKLHERADVEGEALENVATSSSLGAPSGQADTTPSARAVEKARDALTAKHKKLHVTQTPAQKAAAAERSRLQRTSVIVGDVGPGTRPIVLLVLLGFATAAIAVARVRAPRSARDRENREAHPAE